MAAASESPRCSQPVGAGLVIDWQARETDNGVSARLQVLDNKPSALFWTSLTRALESQTRETARSEFAAVGLGRVAVSKITN